MATPKIEEIVSDEEVQKEEGIDSGDEAGGNLDKFQSRAERKARKALIGLGLKKIPNITRVVMKRGKGAMYVISTPDVYKSQNSECYIVFGEAKVEDAAQQAAQLNASLQASAAADAHAGHNHAPGEHHHDDDDDDVPDLEPADEVNGGSKAEEEDDGEVDETGVDPKDIELVMGQVNCSRKKAVKALKESDGDLITAIMAASE